MRESSPRWMLSISVENFSLFLRRWDLQGYPLKGSGSPTMEPGGEVY